MLADHRRKDAELHRAGREFDRAVTHHWLGTSVADKSLVANYGLPDSLALVAEYAIDVVRGMLLGFYPSQAPIGFSRGWAPLYFAPFALVFAGLALVRAAAPYRRPLLTWALAVAALFILLAPNMFLGAHFNRYIMWAFPAVHITGTNGKGSVARMVTSLLEAKGLSVGTYTSPDLEGVNESADVANGLFS